MIKKRLLFLLFLSCLAELNYSKNIEIAVNNNENKALRSKLPELLINTFSAKSNFYTHRGGLAKSLAYDKKIISTKSSLFSATKDNTLQQLKIIAEQKKNISALRFQNNLESKIVKEQKRLSLILIVVASLLLLLLIIACNEAREKNNANKRLLTLMKELHHRVKNNLQILSGLFTMQIEELSDEKTKNTLRENEARLASMNLIHNKLYVDHSNSQIEMGDYLIKLLALIKGSFGALNIGVITDIENILLEPDKAVAIGLIVNELATNAFKYAFDCKGGKILLSLKKTHRSKLLLKISDNGKGLTSDSQIKEMSFGLKLVNLMARQLNTTLITKNDRGTHYQFEIGL